jgi:uncharacterized damage-inducible protein DinB
MVTPMNFQSLQTLLDYHYWARDRVLAAAEALTPDQFTKDLGNSFPSVRDTLVHLFSADWVWCTRWEGGSPQAMLDPAAFPDLASIRNAWTEHERKVRAVLTRLGENGIDRVIEYRLFSGQASAQPFWQILQHVVNHGSYHRGQVTTMLRQLGVAAPRSLDLIAFYRERGATAAH